MVDPSSKILLRIKTSDKAGAETSSSITFAFYNINGKRSKDIEYVCGWMDSFKRGSIKELEADEFAPDFGKPDKIEIFLKTGDWFVEWVEVKDGFTQETFIFPVHRRIKSGKKLRFKLYDCLLPQDDDENGRRQEELADKKIVYQFEYQWPDYMPPQAKCIPKDADFVPDFKKARAKRVVQVLYNVGKAEYFTLRWKSFADLGNIYNDVLPAPKVMGYWREDWHFGNQRLNGVNVAFIRLCEDIPERFPVTNEMLQPLMDNVTIEEAIADKRLYIVDFEILKDLPTTFKENENKTCAPLGLFFVTKDGDLMPVAIQLKQTPGDDNPIFLPTDPPGTWLLAKMWFNNADAACSQMISHGVGHTVAENVVLSTNRCLSTSHPIYRLLAPHMMYTVPNNRAGLPTILDEGRWFDQNFTCGRIGMVEIMQRRFKSFRLDREGHLPNDLKNRGVDDPEALPNYHWRDDMMLLWDAIHKYVSTVVNGNYVSNDKLANDTEIQEWANVLSSMKDGCRIQGVGSDGSFQTREQLVNAVTSLIWICAPFHASANFGQYEQYAYQPNYPTFLHGVPPTDKSEVDDDYLFSILPKKSQATYSLQVSKAISYRTTKNIGDFEVEYQFDPIGTEAVHRFRKDLKTIGRTIDARNEKRTYPYHYLHPRNVPNSLTN